MTGTTFHWQRKDITPRLLMAVGAVTLQWAMIDAEITKMVQLFWFRQNPNRPPPRSFDRRIKNLLVFAATLYTDEPDEHLVFKWYAQRLKTANGLRDDITHGIPGKITKSSHTYDGLMVPKPSGSTKYVPMKVGDIESLAHELTELHRETIEVSGALWAAQAASSPDIKVWQDRGAWTRLTKDNRSPMLPRWNPPPPTFQG